MAGIADARSNVAAVETAAQAVLDAREEHLEEGSTLADLYDPLAHAAGVDQGARRSRPRGGPLLPLAALYFRPPARRVSFTLYEKLAAPLLSKGRTKKQ